MLHPRLHPFSAQHIQCPKWVNQNLEQASLGNIPFWNYCSSKKIYVNLSTDPSRQHCLGAVFYAKSKGCLQSNIRFQFLALHADGQTLLLKFLCPPWSPLFGEIKEPLSENATPFSGPLRLEHSNRTRKWMLHVPKIRSDSLELESGSISISQNLAVNMSQNFRIMVCPVQVKVMFCLFTDTSEHFSDCYKNNVNLLSVNTTAIYLLSHFKLQSLFVLWIFSICGKYQCNFSRASNKTLQI